MQFFSTETLCFPRKFPYYSQVINQWVQFRVQFRFSVFGNVTHFFSTVPVLCNGKLDTMVKNIIWKCYGNVVWGILVQLMCWWSSRESSSAHSSSFGPLLIHQIPCFNSYLQAAAMNLEITGDKLCLWVHIIVLCDIRRGWWMFQKIYR